MEQNEKSKIPKITANQRELLESMKMTMNATSIYRTRALQQLLNPGKDINHECGYPDDISIDDYKGLYDRNGVAKRVVKILPEETWAMLPKIYETEDANETAFEKEWKDLLDSQKVFHYLQRIDILSGIGQYGVLLLGINDGKALNEPVEGINLLTGEKTGTAKYELIYLKPFDQKAVVIKEKEKDVSSPRYGYPVLYDINFENVEESANNIFTAKTVHWTRILHIADNRESSEVLGVPRMKSVYNRLLDVRKILGGSGEMFWKGGFPGYAFKTREDADALTATEKEGIKDEVEEFMNGLQRWMAVEGMDIESLNPQVADPVNHIESNMRNIAISLGIPYRIFLGTEEAKLASAQDVRTWNKRVSERQENYVVPFVIRPFIDRMIVFGVLSEPKEYAVDWPDLNAPTDEDKANVAKLLTEAFSKYVAGGVDNLIPPMEYFKTVIGMTQEEVDAIEKAAMGWIGLEEQEEEVIEEPQNSRGEGNNE